MKTQKLTALPQNVSEFLDLFERAILASDLVEASALIQKMPEGVRRFKIVQFKYQVQIVGDDKSDKLITRELKDEAL